MGKRSPLPPEVKTSALQLAHDILAPMVADGWFSCAFDERYKHEVARYNADDARRRLATLINPSDPHDAGFCEIAQYALGFQLLRNFAERDPSVFKDTQEFIRRRSGPDLPSELKEFVCAVLKSAEVAVSEATKIQGEWTRRVYDIHLAAAVKLIEEGFGIKPTRHRTNHRRLWTDKETSRESASTIVWEKLSELLHAQHKLTPTPLLSEGQVEGSYGRGTAHEDFGEVLLFVWGTIPSPMDESNPLYQPGPNPHKRILSYVHDNKAHGRSRISPIIMKEMALTSPHKPEA
jgi:hypothetical protein